MNYLFSHKKKRPISFIVAKIIFVFNPEALDTLYVRLPTVAFTRHTIYIFI